MIQLPSRPNRPSLQAREAAADALLESAGRYRAQLIAQAVRHGVKSREQAEELFTEAVLRAHDRIQVRGFSGEGEAHLRYLGRIMKLVYREQQRAATKTVQGSLAFWQQLEEEPEAAPRCLAQLSTQINHEIDRFPSEDATAFRLHVEGHSYRQIQAQTGRNYETVRRICAGIRAKLQEVFSSAWPEVE